MNTKMTFKCKCGELFVSSWHNFNDKRFPKRQCNKCGRKKPNDKNKITCNTIIKYLKENNYTCKLISTEFINCDNKLEFQCKCGNHFFCSWSSIKKTNGLCKECTRLNKSIKLRKSNEDLQKQIDEIYGKNQFLLLDRNFSRIKIKHLICQNEFELKQTHFISGQGCKFCNYENNDFGALTNEVFLSRVSHYTNDFDFLSKYKNNHTPIIIKCKKCEYIFQQTPCHIYDRGICCGSCNGSRGEQSIERYLKSNNIKYVMQYRFDGCRHKNLLPFDFYLPDYNICIEYQGKQHYEPVEYFGGEKSFKTQILRDNIKREYCKNNGIILIEISYKDFKNINQILNNTLFCEEVVV